MAQDGFDYRRQQMVESLRRGGITDQRVLDAMAEIPRHFFVPEALRHQAYENSPLPIEAGQTISQPLIVALMTDLLDPQPDDQDLIGREDGLGVPALGAKFGDLCLQQGHPLLVNAGEHALPWG